MDTTNPKPYSWDELLALLMSTGKDLEFFQEQNKFPSRSEKAIRTKRDKEFSLRCKEFSFKSRSKKKKKRPEPQHPSKPATKEADEPTDGLGTDWEALGAGEHPLDVYV